jgi:hypothetical protein
VEVIGYSCASGDEVPRRFARAGAICFVHKADVAGLLAELRRQATTAG